MLERNDKLYNVLIIFRHFALNIMTARNYSG